MIGPGSDKKHPVVENFEPKFCILDCDLKILNNMQCISALSIFLPETVFSKARVNNQCIGYVSYNEMPWTCP